MYEDKGWAVEQVDECVGLWEAVWTKPCSHPGGLEYLVDLLRSCSILVEGDLDGCDIFE